MLKLGQDAKEEFLKGVNRVAEPVKKTAGAEGRFALIENQMGLTPHPTKDGVTVLNSVFGENQFQELGAQMLKSAANKTADTVGDGSTLSTILAQAFINGAFSLKDVSHVEVKQGMIKAVEEVKEHLNRLKRKVNKKSAINIATVSANGDRHLGKLIADIYNKVGIDSTVDIIESSKSEDYVNYLEGIKLDRGYAMPHFCTDFSKGIAEVNDCLVLIYNDKIHAVTEVTDVVRRCIAEKKGLLIVVDDVSEAAMASLIQIKRDSTIPICVSISPEFGDKRTAILEDLAIATGAGVYNSKYNKNISLGKAEKVIAFRDKTIVVPYYNEFQAKIDGRVAELRELLAEADKLNEKSLKNRIANLKSAVAELYIGGTTEMEIKEKRDRVEDAVPALKSALESGYVAGGGSTFYYISSEMNDKFDNIGVQKGYNIVKEGIKEYFNTILLNAALKPKEYSIENYGEGVNVKSREVVDMFNDGIIDSVKVMETALDNALSVSLIALNTEVLILSNNIA